MSRKRVLYITNSHPDLYLGGVEVYSYELYRMMRESGEFEPTLLARTFSASHRARRDTPFHSINDDPNQVLWSVEDCDYFYMSSPSKQQYCVHLDRFLRTYRPDIVHIQHTIGLGFDLIRQIKTSLPGVPVVYTLHEFQPICHANGHMVRTKSEELCQQASPRRCHECFPEIEPRRFFLRERFIKSHLHLVDHFLAPSYFLLERFVDWGIPREKISFLEYGRISRRSVGDPSENLSESQFGFFGQLSPHKGIVTLLQAMKRLAAMDGPEVHLFVNGTNLDLNGNGFRKKVRKLLRQCKSTVTFLGKYETFEITRRMRDVGWVIVPSIWWENSPLVIQEAFMHGRPVICSDIGGMAEKVKDGVDGLHFHVGDAADLAATLMRAASSRDLWEKLRAGISPVYPIEEAIAAHRSIYRSLLEQGVPQEQTVPQDKTVPQGETVSHFSPSAS